MTDQQPSVTMEWQVRETHKRTFDADSWAKFVRSLDINDEYDLPTELTAEAVAKVEDYLNSQDWYAEEVLSDMHSQNTWYSSDDDGHEVELEVSS